LSGFLVVPHLLLFTKPCSSKRIYITSLSQSMESARGGYCDVHPVYLMINDADDVGASAMPYVFF
jgi:hypothetical protein